MAKDYSDKGLVYSASGDGTGTNIVALVGVDGVAASKTLLVSAVDGPWFTVGADQAVSLYVAMLFSGATQYTIALLSQYQGKLTAGKTDPDSGSVDADFGAVGILTTGNNDNGAGVAALSHVYPSSVAGDVIQFTTGRFGGRVKLRVTTAGAGLAAGDRVKIANLSF